MRSKRGKQARHKRRKNIVMEFSDLTEEQKAKAKACKTTEELLALAKEEGVELSADELESISGGVEWSKCNHWENGFCYTEGCDSKECTRWRND